MSRSGSDEQERIATMELLVTNRARRGGRSVPRRRRDAAVGVRAVIRQLRYEETGR
jgi:hypothetical protein